MRRIPLPIHALVELVAGLALLTGALALDLGTAGAVLTFAAGVALAGVGLGAAETLPLSAHQALDRALVVTFAAGSVLVALTGGALAAAVLLGLAVAQIALSGATHWVRAPLAG